MNYVYKITFNLRKQNGEEPYYYIGSKSNAKYENGILFDSRNNPYYGSSSIENWYELIENDNVSIEIIKEFAVYTEALNYESMLQKSLDVVADTRYFNLAIATVSNYSDPSYATYKHTRTAKVVRLPRTHEMVLSGEYVGVSKGTTLSEETRKKIGRSGPENPFYGRKHTNEVKALISQKNSGRSISEERRIWFIENIANMKKTDEHKKKIGRKNLIMLKNRDTGETVRIDKELKHEYDSNIWVNPYILSEKKSLGSKWINNGIENKKLPSGQNVPDGWKLGRIYNSWNDKKRKVA